MAGTHNGPSHCIHGHSMKRDGCKECREWRANLRTPPGKKSVGQLVAEAQERRNATHDL